MAQIGILAFGSLIGDPGDEIAALEVKSERRRNVRTPFPVEFARASKKRACAPTLVPHANGAHVTALYTHSRIRMPYRLTIIGY